MAFTTLEDLARRIEAAFPNTRWGGERACPCKCQECDSLDEDIREKPWQEYTAAETRYLSSGASLFSESAFNHFLPAYLRASLLDPGEADVVPDGVAGCFLTTGHDNPPFRTPALLSSEQREALFDWLEWWIEIEQRNQDDLYGPEDRAFAFWLTSPEVNRRELEELRRDWL